MPSRAKLTKAERERHSRLAQLVHSHGLLRGSLVEMARVCGKPGCRCRRGERHVSLYLSHYANGEQRVATSGSSAIAAGKSKIAALMISVPIGLWTTVSNLNPTPFWPFFSPWPWPISL